MIPWQFRLSLLRAYRLSATCRSTGMIPWKPVWALSARSNARLRCSKAIPRWMCHCLVWKQAENSMEDSITPWIQPWPFQRWTTKAHDAAPKMGKKNMNNNSHGLFGVANGCQEVEGQALATAVCIGLFSARRRSRDPRFLVLNHGGGWRGIRSVPICVNAPLPPIKIS